jgi:hypothetical protein
VPAISHVAEPARTITVASRALGIPGEVVVFSSTQAKKNSSGVDTTTCGSPLGRT